MLIRFLGYHNSSWDKPGVGVADSALFTEVESELSNLSFTPRTMYHNVAVFRGERLAIKLQTNEAEIKSS